MSEDEADYKERLENLERRVEALIEFHQHDKDARTHAIVQKLRNLIRMV